VDAEAKNLVFPGIGGQEAGGLEEFRNGSFHMITRRQEIDPTHPSDLSKKCPGLFRDSFRSFHPLESWIDKF
jgi:hypothetical protein